MNADWDARREFMWSAIYHHGYDQNDLAGVYNVTRERIRQIIKAWGWPYSAASATPLWCPWPRASRPKAYGRWSKKYVACLRCGQTDKAHAGRGYCQRCLNTHLYHTDPHRHAAQNTATIRWQKEHPEQNRVIQKRAVEAWQQRHKEAGLCQSCSQPATRGRMCDKHADAASARERARYAAKKAKKLIDSDNVTN